ncbi:MAG: Fic family protein [Akkermansia sp.]|nr:Fic family protein [Akkermansia sp.]
MRTFDYLNLPGLLLTPKISNLLSAIHEYRGKQTLFITARRDVLQSLLKIAVIQSTDASNRIEGIYTSDARLRELVMQKVVPGNRNEREIAGYRDVLRTIHENYEYIPVTPNTILQLHRDLYSYHPSGMGGHWKSADNLIAETDAAGTKRTRFTPTPAFETPEAMRTLCEAYNEAVALEHYDPLMLMVLFIFDFLCIHPFNDGNGRMSRLLTLMLLYQHGYIVGKYISLEKLIEENKQTYYETLQESSTGWDAGNNNYLPFLQYQLGIILKAYREFERRVEHVTSAKLNKMERIRMMFEQKPGKIRKADIMTACPDISVSLIERTLKQMLDNGEIRKIGASRTTAYIKI